MWFTENPWPPVAASLFLAFIAFAVWNSSRRNLHFVLALAGLLFAAGFFIVERLIVTETERVENRIIAMCDAFRRRDPETENYFAAQAGDLKTVVKIAMKMVTVHDDLKLTDMSVEFTNARSVAKAKFRANATISVSGQSVGRQPSKFEATFIREEGTWKITQVRRLNPINDTDMGLLDLRRE